MAALEPHPGRTPWATPYPITGFDTAKAEDYRDVEKAAREEGLFGR